MHPLTGWIFPKSTSDLPSLPNWRADVWTYLRYPHSILVIRLLPPDNAHGEKNEVFFLVCNGCDLMQMSHYWTIGQLNASSLGSSRICIEDKMNGFKIECAHARVFSADGVKKWFNKNKLFEYVSDTGEEPMFYWGY